MPTLAYSDSGFGVAVAAGAAVGSGVAPTTAVPLMVVSAPPVLDVSSLNATIASGFDWAAPAWTEQY